MSNKLTDAGKAAEEESQNSSRPALPCCRWHSSNEWIAKEKAAGLAAVASNPVMIRALSCQPKQARRMHAKSEFWVGFWCLGVAGQSPLAHQRSVFWRLRRFGPSASPSPWQPSGVRDKKLRTEIATLKLIEEHRAELNDLCRHHHVSR